jgi:hypothetical protein
MTIVRTASLIVLAATASAASAQLTAWGVTGDNRLVSFNTSTPGTIGFNAPITGLAAGERVLGIDARPASASAELVIMTSANRLYSLSYAGAATVIGSGFTPALSTTALGMDFNPTVDRIRVVHSNGDNRRLNPVTGGAVQADTALTYNDGSGLIPRAVGTAYNRFNFGSGAPVGSVRQFIIDSARDILGEVGSQAGGNASFNGGVVTPIGALGFDLSDDAGFDIYGPTETAFISSLSPGGVATFYSLNLGSGAATSLGAVGAAITDFTVVPAPSAAALLGVAALAMGRRRRA